ncbi:hypothetical protein MED217_15575 [Leeuwenhoekiella blandensis MED217]|uniref:Uncharacterized protein n=2 Tax=Leeuwenhoekiella TaxID=283735 RepID=A3XIB9_LEEBM|nr:hypothetical protein MED217_15575 [Leeuwenhoekiella blandensis MED217]
MIAIECDGDPFHSLPEDVAYDVERQEFLERVGWKVYRILYSAYKRNPSSEIEKMVNFIEKYTKKDKVIPIAKVFNETPREEIQKKTTSYTHKSFIDKLQDDLEQQDEEMVLESIEEVETFEEDKILRYFNLNSVGTYTLETHKSNTSIYSLPLYERDKNGYLLLGYTNGNLNKVSISNLLTKKINKQYQNGFNIQASLTFLKIAKKDDIVGLHFEEGGIKKFKAHLIENVTSHKYLFAQGNKVIYKDYTNLKYELFPIEQLDKIKRLVYHSFTATGKALNNSNYENEWKTIIPKKNLELPFNNRQIKSLIQKAIVEKKKVKVLYKNKEGQESERILSNLNIITKNGYSGYDFEVLKADCSLRGTERHFKIDRIREIELLD